MPIEYKKSVAILEKNCDIDEAEPLLAYLLDNPKSKINLKKVQNIHTSVLQVLRCLKPKISAKPEDESIKQWLLPLIAADNN